MEFVNEFIFLSIQPTNELDSSFCEINQDKNYIYLKFGLSSIDCLFNLDSKSYQIDVRISKTYFEKYNDNLPVEINHQSICCNMQLKLWEIVNCKLEGITRKIFLESTILFLLCRTQKDGYNTGCESCELSNRTIEIDRIYQAKKFILENLSSNLTIPIIAKNVGLNECYLKKGFKEIFNQTIFDFIQENRMITAKHLLESKNLSITEVAFSVGYSSLS
ncbi:MAG: AraC family transcriptional regulator, partial [Ignavibacterium sp.]|nr:AraC family transcriptional regulator [Ignavibacterium sp.]MDW8376152.1 AraC family transcriptional regulator [Ignavibacteriales bacterium]